MPAKKNVTFFDVNRLDIKKRAHVRENKWGDRHRNRFHKTNPDSSRSPETVFREGGEMKSMRMFYLAVPLMVFGLMIAPALAATPDYLNYENALVLSSQNVACSGCPTAADMLSDPIILAKNGSGGPGSGSGGPGSGGGGPGPGSGGPGLGSGPGSGGPGPGSGDGDGSGPGPGSDDDDGSQVRVRNRNRNQNTNYPEEPPGSQHQTKNRLGEGHLEE